MAPPATKVARGFRVLYSVAPPGRTVKFIDQVVTHLPSDVTKLYFSWATALWGRYDIFHVHWPEFLMRGRSPLIRLARTGLFIALQVRLKLTPIAVVRTVHNLAPHEPGNALESWLLAGFDSRVDRRILVNGADTPSEGATIILHGHYIDQFAHLPKPPFVANRLLYIGRIEPYKGVDVLISAFEHLHDPRAELRIVGSANDALRAELVKLIAGDTRIATVFEFVADEQLVREISLAEVVVLPYREMHNSGIALVALSLNRPVLVPRTPSSRALAAEVGDNWVYEYDGELTAATLERALKQSRSSTRSATPSLRGRDWTTVGQAHYDVYVAALESRLRHGLNSLYSTR